MKEREKHDQGCHDFCQDVRGNNIAVCTYFLQGNLHIPRDQITVVTLYFVVTNDIRNRLAQMKKKGLNRVSFININKLTDHSPSPYCLSNIELLLMIAVFNSQKLIGLIIQLEATYHMYP